MTMHHPRKSVEVGIRFEPVVDFLLGRGLGYVIRPCATDHDRDGDEGEQARLARDLAHEQGALVMKERAWRRAAVEQLSRSRVDPEALLFMDVDPRVLDDKAFSPGATRELLSEFGLAPKRFLIRLRVPATGDAWHRARVLARHYAAQGFPIALDGVGGDSASMQAVHQLEPRVIGLDAQLLRGISADPLRCHLVGAIASYCGETSKLLVAGGVDSWGDLAAARRAGVRFGRGFVLGRAALQPEPIDSGTRGLLARLGRVEAGKRLRAVSDAAPANPGGRAA